jgi:hypothetical protein
MRSEQCCIHKTNPIRQVQKYVWWCVINGTIAHTINKTAHMYPCDEGPSPNVWISLPSKSAHPILEADVTPIRGCKYHSLEK